MAVGHGKEAARHIDSCLRGSTVQLPPKHAHASFERLNPWYYSDAHRRRCDRRLELARRTSSFDEAQGGLSADNALFEARRCLSCGSCFECDNCYGVCPDNTVIKLGPGKRFEFNYDYGKGCGMRVAECPCGAIGMVPEQGQPLRRRTARRRAGALRHQRSFGYDQAFAAWRDLPIAGQDGRGRPVVQQAPGPAHPNL